MAARDEPLWEQVFHIKRGTTGFLPRGPPTFSFPSTNCIHV